MWVDWLRTRPYWADLRLTSPARSAALSELEEVLGHLLPPDLRELLSETDGVFGPYEAGLVWPVNRIAEDNVRFRSDFAELYMNFDSLLFFADAGNGDQFAFPVLPGKSGGSEVFVWNHEDDSRTWKARDLRTYIDEWMTGLMTT